MPRGDNTAAELQNLVTGILVPDAEDEEQLLEEASELSLYQRSQEIAPSQFEILGKGRELEKLLAKADPKKDEVEIRDSAADWAVMTSRSRMQVRIPGEKARLNSTDAVFFLLHDFLRSPSKESLSDLHNYVRSYNNTLELSTIQSSIGQTLTYLEERWGDDTVEKIREITGASKPTVNKWLAGSDPSSSNRGKLRIALEVNYALETVCELSREEAAEWINSPCADLNGDSPWETIKSSGAYWSMPLALRTAIDKLAMQRK